MGLQEFGIVRLSSLLLGGFIRLGGLDLLFVRFGLFLHLFGFFNSLCGRLDHGLGRLFEWDLVGLVSSEAPEDTLEHLLLLLEGREFASQHFELSFLGLTNGTLVITKDGHLPVGIVVLGNLLCR